MSSIFRINAASSTINNDNASDRAPVDELDIALFVILNPPIVPATASTFLTTTCF